MLNPLEELRKCFVSNGAHHIHKIVPASQSYYLFMQEQAKRFSEELKENNIKLIFK